MLVVWEPVIMSDIAPPTTRTLARIADPRAVQFWDNERLISQEILRASSVAPDGAGMGSGSDDGEIVWDYVAIHPAGGTWEDVPPAPEFEGGTVLDVIDEVRRHLGVEDTTRR